MRERVDNTMRRLRQDLDRSLFRSSLEPARKASGREGALAAIGFLTLAVILQLFRAGPTEVTNSVWAEDGPFFLAGAINHGFFDSLTQTYAGYLVLVQRLIGELGSLVPLQDASFAIALGSCVVIAISGLVVWIASAGHVRNPYLRGLLAALTVLCPVASLEAIASGTYVTWYMTFAAFWLLLWRPRSDRGAVLAGLFILVTALSSPAIFFLTPLVLLRGLATRDRRDAILVGSFALGLAIQVAAVLLTDESTIEPVWTWDIATAYLQRVMTGSALGEELGGSLWADLGWPFLIALTLAVGVLLVALVARAASGRLLAAIAIPTSMVLFAISAYQRAVGAVLMWPEGIHSGLGGRYAIIPSLLLISAIVVLVDSCSRSRENRSGALLVTGVVAVLMLALVTSFPVGDRSIRGTPEWDASLRQAAMECGPQEPTAIVYTSPPGTTALLPCDEVRSAVGFSAAR